LDFNLGWFADPLWFGDYPASLKQCVKDDLPVFTEEEKKMVKGSLDYQGINFYTGK
jgi:beta-glucosidase